MASLDSRFGRGERISWRVIGDEAVLVDRDEAEVLRLNPVATAIWHALDGKRTVNEIIDHVCRTFEVDRQRAQKDVLYFLNQLVRRETVEEGVGRRKRTFMTPSPIPHISGHELGQRLSEKLLGGRLPLSGQWELTCRCNLKCIMCYTDPFNTPERIRHELSYKEITRILDELHEAGCIELCLTGGEPLARRDFLDIYVYAKLKGFLVTVFTNGTLITTKVADRWVEYPPSMIEISLHGLSPESFESITQGRGSYERCLAGIRLILERDLPLTIKTTGMTVNRDEILKIKEYVAGLGSERRHKVRYKFGSDIRPRLDGTEDVYHYQLPEDDVIAIEQAEAEFCRERTRQDRLAEAMLREGKDLCAGGKRKFHIDAYGQLQLCSNNRRQSYDLRRGSFREGFYEFLPQFPCPNRVLPRRTERVSLEPRRGPRDRQGLA